jgi:NAD(P)H-flavin reductase
VKNQNIKDVLGGNIKFHEELDRIRKDELIGAKFVLRDARIIDDWDGRWGTSEFALLQVQLEDGREVTTLCGGVAIVRQVRKLLKRGRLPGRIDCFLNFLPSTEKTGQNYYLLDWQQGDLPIEVKTVDKSAEVEPVKPAEVEPVA